MVDSSEQKRAVRAGIPLAEVRSSLQTVLTAIPPDHSGRDSVADLLARLDRTQEDLDPSLLRAFRAALKGDEVT